jgi:hypothetical protein
MAFIKGLDLRKSHFVKESEQRIIRPCIPVFQNLSRSHYADPQAL